MSGVSSKDRPSACPQCGEDWTSRDEFLEECPACKSTLGLRPIDPFAVVSQIASPSGKGAPGLVEINRRSKPVIRYGILGLAFINLAAGVLLFATGWGWPAGFAEASLDLIQLWFCRLGGPILLVQGVALCRLPFRKPRPADVIPFKRG